MPRHGRATVYILGLLSMTAVLAAFGFLDIMSRRPGRAPILTLSVSYPVDRWPANAWVEEKTDWVRALDGDAFHVRAVDLVTDESSGEIRPLEALKSSIRDIDRAMPSHQPLVIYLNAHMAVNDRNEVCLIGPDSDPQQSETWHRIGPFVRGYFEGEWVKSGRPLVFLVDSNRLQRWLPAGLLNNEISTHLEALSAEYAHTNSTKRVGWLLVDDPQATDAERSGQPVPFTRLLCETIATGGQIDSASLRDGVQARLDQWARDHAVPAVPQVRWFDTGGTEPIELATLSPNPISALEMQLATSVKLVKNTSPASEQPSEIRSSLEHDFGSFDGTDIARSHPWRWLRLHADAERWVAARSSGRAAADQATTLERRWMKDLRRLQSMVSDSETVSELTAQDPLRSTLHEIDSRAKRFADAWRVVAKSPTRETVSQLVSQAKIDELDACPLMVALLAEPTRELWNQPDHVSRLATAQASALTTVSEVPVETFGSVRIWIDQLDDVRRQAADAALASSQTEIAALEDAIEVFESSVKQLGPRIQLWSMTWRAARRANLAVPFFWTMILENPEPWSDASAVTHFLQDWEAARATAEAIPTKDDLVDGSEMQQCQQRIRRIDAFLDRVENQWRQVRLSAAAEAGVTKTMQRRDSQEIERLSQRFAEICFQTNPTSWSAWRVRQQLRMDATTVIRFNREALPEWSSTIMMQPDALADLRAQSLEDHQRRQRVCDEIERVMDDFWRGSIDEPVARFDLLASSMLASLRDSLAEAELPETALVDRQQMLEERWKRCRTFLADDSIRPTATLNGVQLAGVAVEAEAHVESAEKLPANVQGTAVIRIHQGDEFSTSNVVGQSIVNWNPLPTHDSPVSLAVQADFAETDQSLVVVLSFRGHQFAGHVTGATHARLVRRRPAPTTTTASIRLERSSVRRRAVVFVVDASASMNEDAPAEQTRNPPDSANARRASTKLDAARAAVLAATDRLWQRQCDLGMVVYGHRVAIDAKQGTTLIQKRYAKQFPFSFSIPAYRDVEVAVPVGRFGNEQYAAMEDRLTNLVPWGQSPLHLAINAAIDDLVQSGPHQSREVVVITDGRNYQFNPTPDAVLSIDAIIDRAKTESVRVHVVGFAGQASDSGLDSPSLNPFLTPLSRATGGWQTASVHDFVNGLLRDEAPNPDRFEIMRLDALGEPVGPSEMIQAGQTVTLDTEVPANQRWQISLAQRSTSMFLSPGDQLRFQVDNERNQQTGHRENDLPLRRQPESTPPLIWLPLQHHGKPISRQLGVWQTRLQDQTTAFRFGWNDIDALTTPRPERVWVEATAMTDHDATRFDSQSPTKYTSSLVRWLPGHGLPIAEYVCEQWPMDAREFDLRVWAGSSTVARHHVLDLPNAQHSTWTSDRFPGHRFELSRRHQTITLTIHYPERPATDGGDAMWIVESDATGQHELSAEWYDPSGSVSVHEFTQLAAPDVPDRNSSTLTLLSATPANAPSDAVSTERVRLISIADFKRDAIVPESPHHGPVTSITTSVGSAASRVKRR